MPPLFRILLTSLAMTLLLTFIVSVTDNWLIIFLALFLIGGLTVAYSGYVYHLGTVMTLKGDLRGAIRHYGRVLKLPVDKAFIYTRRAALRNAVGDLDGAIEDYSAAIELTIHERPVLLGIRSALYLGKHEYQKALDDSNQLLSIIPDSEIGYANRAVAKLFLGDVEGAIDDCTKGLDGKVSPSGKALLLNNRGTAYRIQGDYTESLSNYNLALSVALKPQQKKIVHPPILTNLGILYFLQEDYEASRVYAQQSRDLNTGFLKSLVILAASRVKLDQIEEARKSWQELTAREPRARVLSWIERDMMLPMSLVQSLEKLIEY